MKEILVRAYNRLLSFWVTFVFEVVLFCGGVFVFGVVFIFGFVLISLCLFLGFLDFIDCHHFRSSIKIVNWT